MSSKTLLSLVLGLYFGISVQAQAWGRKPILSPEIHPDNTVTFRIFAPAADSIKLSGNWMSGWGTAIPLIKNDTGLFELTTGPLPTEMYTYNFIISGVSTIDPANAVVVRDGQRNFSMFLIPGEMTELYGVNKVPHGTLEKIWYSSPKLGMDRRMYVYTPPGYAQSGAEYPVLYLLHGGGGDEDAWTTLGRAPQILDNLIAAGRAKPMIVVMTNGNPGEAAAPGDGPAKAAKQGPADGSQMGRGKFEESLVFDVIPFIEKNYRVIKNKDSRAVAGLSMGGIQTMTLANTHPEMFSWYGVMSMGLVDMSRFGGENNENERVANLAKLRATNPKLYWVACGKTDFLYKSVVDLRKFLDDQKFPYIYRETEGGHTWENWRIYLSELTPMLFK